MKRGPSLLAFGALVVIMSSAQEKVAIEMQVDAKKDLILQHNAYAKDDPDLLREKAFC